MWSDIAGLVGAPIVVWALATGYGLLFERVAAVRLENSLLVLIGFCLAIVVSLGVYATNAGNSIAVPVVVVLALAGFALARRELSGRLNGGWPLLAGVGAYVLFNASVIMSGHWTFTGYNIENDSAYEFVLVSHLMAHGMAPASHVLSTANTVISSYLSTGYPLGSQSLLGVVSGILGVAPAVVWQGFISSMAGVGAMAASRLSERTAGPRTAAFIGLVAMAAALTYQYALQGSIKEIGAVVVVLCALAVMRHAILTLDARVGAIAVAIPLAALLAVFNAAGIPYVGALMGSGLLAVLWLRRLRPSWAWVKPALIGSVTLLICAAPALLTLGTFYHVAKTGYTGSHATAPQLGPLFRPLPLSEVSGVWLFGDYRLPVPPGTGALITIVATVLILSLLAPAVLRMISAREPGPLMGLATMALVLIVVYPRVVPYAQAKLLAIASPIVVLCAAQSLTGARGCDWKALCAVATFALGAAVIVSDAIAYHAFPVAPVNRLTALKQMDERVKARGPVLDSEFEQFAKYFAQPAQLIDGPDSPTPEGLALLHPGAPQYGHSFDLDQEQLPFVESFRYVLTRVSPAMSRPPANYRLIQKNSFYEIWERESAPRVYAHIPLGEDVASGAAVPCSTVRSLVRKAPPASRLAIAIPPPVYGYEMAAADDRSSGWAPDGNVPGGMITGTPGHARKTIRVARGGEYQLWIQGDLPRRVAVTLDGRSVGSAIDANTPGGWSSAGMVHIASGRHLLGVERGGGGLAPGDGSTQASIDAVALQAVGPGERVVSVSLHRWRSICGAYADWVELVSQT